jgi:hypothetical protein
VQGNETELILLAPERLEKRRAVVLKVCGQFGHLVPVEHEVHRRVTSSHDEAECPLGIRPANGNLRARRNASAVIDSEPVLEPKREVGGALILPADDFALHTSPREPPNPTPVHPA